MKPLISIANRYSTEFRKLMQTGELTEIENKNYDLIVKYPSTFTSKICDFDEISELLGIQNDFQVRFSKKQISMQLVFKNFLLRVKKIYGVLTFHTTILRASINIPFKIASSQVIEIIVHTILHIIYSHFFPFLTDGQ